MATLDMFELLWNLEIKQNESLLPSLHCHNFQDGMGSKLPIF